MKLELQYFEGCPGYEPMREIVRSASSDMGISFELEEVHVRKPEQLRAIGFKGSPTLLVEGRDIEDRQDVIDALGCRLYKGKPAPDRWLIESALLRALKPKHFLFMCVQNSARSQLAEAIARHFAPEGITVKSAGSSPAFVRPLALQVLEEAGIPTEGLSSKAVDDIDCTDIDVVITLCADEVCPIYLGRAIRLHWGLPDPAHIEPEKAKLEAFRNAREELMKRLKHLFAYQVD